MSDVTCVTADGGPGKAAAQWRAMGVDPVSRKAEMATKRAAVGFGGFADAAARAVREDGGEDRPALSRRPGFPTGPAITLTRRRAWRS